MKKWISMLLTAICVFGACSAQAERELPSPHIYFGVANQYKPEAITKTDVSMGFDEYPGPIVSAYSELLREEYGLIQSSREMYPANRMSNLVTFEHQTFFLDPKTKRTVCKMYWMNANMRTKLLRMEFSADCVLKPLEVWEGDVSKYLYNQSDWEKCSACRGLNKCLKCSGRGYEIDSDGYKTKDCEHCVRGECPAGCYGGKIRIHE